MLNKKEELSNLFLKRISDGKSIKYKDFKTEDSSLLYKIEKVFGGITKCAEYSGISKDELLNKYGMRNQIHGKMLSDDEILSRLIFLKSIGKLNTNNMRLQFNDLRLEYSLKKKYGSVQKALDYYNLKRDTKVIKYEDLVSEIKHLESINYDLSYTNILENKSNIMYNLSNKTGLGWYDSLKLIGVNYTPLVAEKYTKESVQKKLIEIIEKEGSISYSILRNNYSGILSYVRANYSSIYDFYLDFGYEPTKFMDLTTQKAKGFLFEKVFKEILDCLNIKYEYNKYLNDNTIRPDFILDNGVILDCKLSSWTHSIESTFNSYKNHSNKVIVVYLRGKNEYCSVNDDKFEIQNVEYYLNKLNKKDKLYFKGKLEYILNNDNFIETVTTERTTTNQVEITV